MCYQKEQNLSYIVVSTSIIFNTNIKILILSGVLKKKIIKPAEYCADRICWRVNFSLVYSTSK